MNYRTSASNLTATAKSYDEVVKIKDLLSVVEQMITEMVPPLVEKYVKEHTEDLIINIQTMINGAAIDLPDVRKEIIRQIGK